MCLLCFARLNTCGKVVTRRGKRGFFCPFIIVPCFPDRVHFFPLEFFLAWPSDKRNAPAYSGSARNVMMIVPIALGGCLLTKPLIFLPTHCGGVFPGGSSELPPPLAKASAPRCQRCLGTSRCLGQRGRWCPPRFSSLRFGGQVAPGLPRTIFPPCSFSHNSTQIVPSAQGENPATLDKHCFYVLATPSFTFCPSFAHHFWPCFRRAEDPK